MAFKRYRWRTALALAVLLAAAVPVQVRAEGEVPKAETSKGNGSASAGTITKEQALAAYQKYFAAPAGPGQVTASLGNFGQRMVWHIMYTVTYGNGASSSGIGTVDAQTGRIISASPGVGSYGPVHTGRAPKAISEEEARAKAWLLVKEMAPEMAEFLRPAPAGLAGGGYYGDSALGLYAFTWMTYRGDVPVMDSSVTVAVDKYSGEYRGFNVSAPENVTFKDGRAKLTAEEALKQFQSAMQPELIYRFPSDKPVAQVKTATLVYRFPGLGVLDAESGKFQDFSGREVLPAAWENVAADADKPAVARTPDEAKAVAKELFGLTSTDQLRLDPGHMGPSDGNTYISVGWYGEEGSGNVSFDAQSGRLQSAYRSGRGGMPRPRKEEPTAEEMAKAKAVALAVVKRYYSDLIPNVKLQAGGSPDYYGSTQLAFWFQRHVNGLPVEGQGIRVVVDLESMNWTQVSNSWTEDLTFPAPGKEIAKEQAAQTFFQGRRAVLTYRADYPQPGFGFANESPRTERQVYLLVAPPELNAYGFVDAASGKLVDYAGRSPADASVVANRLAGHWAEMELRWLTEIKVIAPEQLDPEAPVARKLGVDLAFTAVDGMQRFYYGTPDAGEVYTDVPRTSPVFNQVTAAIQRGILLPSGEHPLFDGERAMTRAEFSVWLARALGFGRLARAPLKVTTGFTDLGRLSEEEARSVAFLEALGIVKADAAFRGQDPLTQGEAAAMVARTLNLRRSGT